jgi:hypothetical protein
MAFYSTNSTVATTATVIANLPVSMGQGRALQIQNNDSASIYVGTETVATSGATRGHVVLAGQTYQVWLNGGDVVYAISAAGTTAGAVVCNYSA